MLVMEASELLEAEADIRIAQGRTVDSMRFRNAASSLRGCDSGRCRQ